MRIYQDVAEMVREVERDLWEMGHDVHPQTMQDKDVADDPDYMTKELPAYGFKVKGGWEPDKIGEMVNYVLTGELGSLPHKDYGDVALYIEDEFTDRICGAQLNPGKSYKRRPYVWDQFLHNGKFAYTYSERIAPQLSRIVDELNEKPETRQAIINIHNNLSFRQSTPVVGPDLVNMGGVGRIPCSMYYQFIRRGNALDMVYCMRSCDFLVHFPVDIALALRIQELVAMNCEVAPGILTYFTGSLHAYYKDMRARGVF